MIKIEIPLIAKKLAINEPQKISTKDKILDLLNINKVEYFNKVDDLYFDTTIQNQYIAALHKAFDKHHPFIINPDDIWLLIMQGLAIHINQNSDKFRDILVEFEGKKDLLVRHDGLIKGDDKNTWSLIFPYFEQKISENLKDANLVKQLIPTFSTSTELDLTCFRIALMDICQSYFTYTVYTKCGIPEIYIDGTKEDWLKLSENMNDILPIFGLGDWEWQCQLNIILNKILNTFNGVVDVDFFKNIYKFQSMSGGDRVSGWICDLFPYKSYTNWKTDKPVLERRDMNITELSTSYFPSSISNVPFIWDYYNEKYDMNFYSGFCGYSATKEGAIKAQKNYFIAYK